MFVLVLELVHSLEQTTTVTDWVTVTCITWQFSLSPQFLKTADIFISSPFMEKLSASDYLLPKSYWKNSTHLVFKGLIDFLEIHSTLFLTSSVFYWSILFSFKGLQIGDSYFQKISTYYNDRVKVRVYIYIYITADSTVSAFRASSVQCWCWSWGLAI